MDERSLAHTAHTVRAERAPENSEEHKSSFYCLEGWVFLGSLDHDGEEVVEAIRCRRCKGSGQVSG